MGQLTIYLDDGIEQRLDAAAKSARLSRSKWVARLIEEKVASEWPPSIAEMGGVP